MTWDITTPAGSEAKAQGDDRIRELKTDLQTALRGNTTDGLEAKFPGSDTANPVFRYRGLKGTTGARPAAGQYGLYINTDTNTVQRDNGSSWEDIATLVTSGSIDETALATSVAGDGLTGGGGTPLAVNPGTGLEIDTDTVRIAAAAAGNGLTGGGGSALAVNVDDSTIEINADSLRVKDSGITTAKLVKGTTTIPDFNDGATGSAQKTINGFVTRVSFNWSTGGSLSGIGTISVTTVVTRSAANPSSATSGSVDTGTYQTVLNFTAPASGITTSFTNVNVEYFAFP